MALLRAAKKDEIPPGTIREFQLNGTTVAIANVDGKLYAINNTCLHRGGPLGEGELAGAVIVARFHENAYQVIQDVKAKLAQLEDGLPPGEAAFLACSFWFVDNLVLQGRVAEARTMFERLLSLRNDVGLLAEEYDPSTLRQMGNFPQAFSHVALINTAYNLTRYQGPAEERAPKG